MGRSLKKGPFVADHLISKVEMGLLECMTPRKKEELLRDAGAALDLKLHLGADLRELRSPAHSDDRGHGHQRLQELVELVSDTAGQRAYRVQSLAAALTTLPGESSR